MLREDIFIETIETEEKDIEKKVKAHIKERFGYKDDILYNYIVEHKNKTKFITIYLINTASLDQLKDFMSMFKIKSVWPIQIKFMKNVKKSYKNFNMFIEDRDKIYILHIQNRKLIYTKIVENKYVLAIMDNLGYNKEKNAFVYGGEEFFSRLKECNQYDKILKLGESLYGV